MVIIDFPVLGKISVAGMTRSELTDLMTDKLATYVKDPIVTVQIRNFKVSVLGEVTKPGTVSVPMNVYLFLMLLVWQEI
jgi:polysaccharide export outer membrane protein